MAKHSLKNLKQTKQISTTVESSAEQLATSQLMQSAVKHHQSGALQDAEALYLKVLQIEPGNSDAIHLLGVLARQLGRYNEAVKLIKSAISINDTDPNYHCNLGSAFRHQGDLPESIISYQRALDLNPNFVEAYNNLGEALAAQGKYSEAETCYQRVLSLKPDFALAHYNLGNTLRANGDPEAAISCYQRMLELDPGHALTHNNLGLAQQSLDNLDEAKACFRRALYLEPDLASTLIDLGNILRLERNYDEAITCFKRVLDRNPDNAIAQYNMGLVLYNCGNLTEAAGNFDRCLALNPGLGAAHNYLGLISKDMGRMEDSIAHFKKALEIDPGDTMAHDNFLMYLNYAPGFNRTTVFLEHQRFNALHAAPLTHPPAHRNSRNPLRKLRIGYISPDFRKHANAYFFEPVLEHHNHEQFEIYCYYTDTQFDRDNQRLQQYSDHWLNCSRLTDDALTETIKRDQIDILVDLAGHTANNRLLVFARKPAPVQIAYLGYPNTRGLPSIDYRITDRHIEPENDADQFSSETLIRMPESWYCFRPPDDSPPVSELPAIENDYITFGSLNQYCKTNHEVLNLWAQVLHAVPLSRLLVNTHTRSLNDHATRQVFETHLAKLGISPDRLILDDKRPPPNHLSSYHHIDIGLDTFPHNGGATTCEALWMGVPVVTLPGQSLASRMSMSILSTLKLTELIARSQKEYVDICVKLASDTKKLRRQRIIMREKMQASALMDPATFTRQLETTYQNMWKVWCENS